MEHQRTMRAPAAARVLGVSHRTVTRWVHNGTIKGIKVGKTILIPVTEIDRITNAEPSEHTGQTSPAA
jgi:excisionase family DNA binding protein